MLRGKNPKLAAPSRPKIVVYGEAGVGKTWAALDWPSCYYIDGEDGASLPNYTDKLQQSGAAYFGTEDGAGDFDAVITEVRELSTTKHDYRTLIIDGLSKIFHTAIQVEFERLNGNVSFGSEKKPAIAKMRMLLRWLDQLDMNVILICHSKTKWSGGESVGTEPDCWDKTVYELNLVVEILKTGATRKARVIKSRFEAFPMGSTLDWSYAEFSARFGNDILLRPSKSDELATLAQCAEARQLIDELRISDTDVAKVFDAAGVTRWEDMSHKRIAAAITKLKGKKK